jgi:hypothetical protein
MAFILRNYLLAGLVRIGIGALVSVALVACGGGGGSPGTTTGVGSGSGSGASGTAFAINFVSAAPNDKSIVIKGAGGNGRTEVALLTFKVVDSANKAVANQSVTFATQSSAPVSLTATTGTTGADGQVTVALNSGATPTTVRVIATITGTTISALSDTVTVTTGQPAQAAFSISQEKFYVEGLNFDNIPNKITVLLADAFGGAVADGTQVVFTTDSGAIVGTGGAACLTVQGACTVTWRSQNPRATNGLATIIATATNATSTLSAQTRFYYSGSYGIVYAISPASVAGATTRITNGGAMSLSFSGNCNPQSFNIEVVDVNDNPMPEGTVLSAVNATNASVTISPSIVANTGLRLNSVTRGTVHNVTVTPTGCNLTGTKQVTGFVDLSVKTPLGGETFTRISLGTFLTN